MKKKCAKCGFENLEDSEFCQECGTQLTLKTESKSYSFNEGIEKIEDVVFKPKKKGFVGRIIKLFLILAICFIGLIVFVMLLPTNESTQTGTKNTNDVDLTSFPINELSIEELDAEWVGQQLYIKGILKNNYSNPAKNVGIRVDFYKDKEMKQLFDTRYITVVGVSAKGAYNFNEPIDINEPPSQQPWYNVQIESAEYLK